jgi:cold shock CspA family protein
VSDQPSRTGRVDAFDEQRGTGVVIAESGERFPFHSTAIADGTRVIAAGTAVRFEVQPGLGRWEAGDVRPV